MKSPLFEKLEKLDKENNEKLNVNETKFTKFLDLANKHKEDDLTLCRWVDTYRQSENVQKNKDELYIFTEANAICKKMKH